MAKAKMKWRMKGKWLKNCSCAAGCPCDFNARPTNGKCEGMVGMKIDEGHFDDVNLKGLSWAVVYHWPGPLHEGNGTIQPVIDQKANERQRNALLTILSGKEQQPGTFFQIVSMIVTQILPPQFLPIDWQFDLKKRTARCAVAGIFETASQPIKNPVTGAEHRIQVVMPEGFEYKEAEVASASVKGVGELKFDWSNSHSSMALVEHTPKGVL